MSVGRRRRDTGQCGEGGGRPGVCSGGRGGGYWAPPTLLENDTKSKLASQTSSSGQLSQHSGSTLRYRLGGLGFNTALGFG